MDRGAEFGRWKAQSLSKADLSRKGSVDEDAVAVVELLNSREEFFTTSSCAGRILLLDGVRLPGSSCQYHLGPCASQRCWLPTCRRSHKHPRPQDGVKVASALGELDLWDARGMEAPESSPEPLSPSPCSF